MNKLAASLVALASVLGTVQAQSIVATSRFSRTDLPPQGAYISFVQSSSDTAEAAVKDASLSIVAGHAILAAGGKLLPIPIVGPYLTGPVVEKLSKMLHPAKPITGFNVAFVQGLSARTVLQQSETTFTIPAELLQGGAAALVRFDFTLCRASPTIKRKPTLCANASSTDRESYCC
jgi:hypothetical protein